MLRILQGLLPGQWMLLHKQPLIDLLAIFDISPCQQRLLSRKMEEEYDI